MDCAFNIKSEKQITKLDEDVHGNLMAVYFSDGSAELHLLQVK
jgi:hypothetical protein